MTARPGGNSPRSLRATDVSRAAFPDRSAPAYPGDMSGVDAYVQHVDRLLAGARKLFPEGSSPSNAAEEPSALPSAPDEASGLGSTVAQGVTQYHGARARAEAITAEMSAAAEAAHAGAIDAGGTAASIHRTAAAHAAAIRPEAGSPEAVVLLVSRMDERLERMQDHIHASKAALAAAGEQIRAHGQDLATLGHRR
jgi:hypothetical protein